MFSWWSSLGPEQSQVGENPGEKPAEGGNKTEEDVKSIDDGKTAENEKKKASGDSKISELDYAKDVAKNVGSK